ncbi:hypothetical protein COEREDRAFT_9442 [Coemansia reversa NRRL 1564]|uniref:Uncharacterized protein n=1 Tax=Coemansia reversa (strain ATCC 12441 / NRRL 1564) TaxID=763665 RepID=A0A2G5B993_COERN|nr:hypothetical protein COEREDRAFT_9442 [Coemansia reversa NRRL 1564]|eukprot:PIA15297.1 hypothetical protein COEREDRAFT_9442 [Coemansia reversa NRRL 1564]
MGAYYIEVLDNLQVVDIYAASETRTHRSTDDVVQLIGEDSVKINGHPLVRLPVATAWHKLTRSYLPANDGETSGWIRIRVAIDYRSRKARLATSPQGISGIRRPVTAALLEQLEDICCQRCNAHLLSEALTKLHDRLNIRDLPSSHWSELVDCWMCHPEEDKLNVNPDLMYTFEPEREPLTCLDSLDMMPPSAIDMHMWLGNTFVLVPMTGLQGLQTKLVALDAQERFDNAFTVLQCESCENVVGEAGRVGRRHVYKLYSDHIRFMCKSEILSHASAHAVYKYVIEGRKSCKPAILIHLVGWNAELLASPIQSANLENDQKEPAFEKCIKVLFLKTEDKEFEEQAMQWLDDDATELLSLLDSDCGKLIELLTENSLRIPSHLRTMLGMSRSFLPQ